MHGNKDQRAFALKPFKEGARLLFNDDKQALEYFKEAYTIDPSFAEAFYNAGVANESLGNKKDAEKDYANCLHINNEQEYCLYNDVLLLYELGDEKQARVLVDKYLNEYQDAAFAKVAAAKLALIKGDLREAEKMAREALDIDAENVEALYVMARIYFLDKRYAATRFVAKNALERAPSHGQFHYLLGRTYEALDLLHDAEDSYKLAVEYYPSEEALETYGLMLLRRGKVKEALMVLKRLSELRPSEYRSFLHLGNAFMANKMVEDAKNAYKKALELNPHDKDIYFNLGLLFYDFKPENMTELERFNLSLSYFNEYLDKASLPPARIAEVQEYVKKLKNNIEALELEAKTIPDQDEAKEADEKAQD